MDTQSLIAPLQLEPHIEGGYFRRSYQSAISSVGTDEQSRSLMSSIYYLLTRIHPLVISIATNQISSTIGSMVQKLVITLLALKVTGRTGYSAQI